jgi:TatA/E family protein of Tat protein translocase
MEMIVIFLLILVLFGPRRLPEIAKMIGKALHELRRASEDFKDQVMSIETDVVESVESAVKSDLIAEDADDCDSADTGELEDSYDWSVEPSESDPYADDYDSEMPDALSEAESEEPTVNESVQADSDDKSSRDIAT